MVKNPPADAGDMDSFSDQGTENPQAVEQPTLGAAATEPVLGSKRSPPSEKPTQRSKEAQVQTKINKNKHLKKKKKEDMETGAERRCCKDTQWIMPREDKH